MTSIELDEALGHYRLAARNSRRIALALNVLLITLGLGWMAWSASVATRSQREAAAAETRRQQATSQATQLEARRALLEQANRDIEQQLGKSERTLRDREERLSQVQTQIGEVQKAVEGEKGTTATLDSVRSIVSATAPVSRWQEGQTAYQAGNVEGARAIWLEVTQQNPSYAPAWNGLGKYAEEVSKDRAAAKVFYEKAAAANATYAPALVNLGRLAEQEKNWAEADAFCRKARKARPDYSNARVLGERLKAHGFDCGL